MRFPLSFQHKTQDHIDGTPQTIAALAPPFCGEQVGLSVKRLAGKGLTYVTLTIFPSSLTRELRRAEGVMPTCFLNAL